MTAHDPQLALRHDLPWRFERRADDRDNDDAAYAANDAADAPFADEIDGEVEGGDPWAIAVVAAALLFGIGVGAGATFLLMPSHRARPPAAIAPLAPAAPSPARTDISRTAPPVAQAPSGAPGAIAHEPAPAAKSVPPRAHRSATRPTTAGARLATACNASGGQREMLICAWPTIAAADRTMRRAYQHALDAGVERSLLQASQDRWSTTSEFAARRSAADLAAAYDRRIGELNALAADEPPH